MPTASSEPLTVIESEWMVELQRKAAIDAKVSVVWNGSADGRPGRFPFGVDSSFAELLLPVSLDSRAR